MKKIHIISCLLFGLLLGLYNCSESKSSPFIEGDTTDLKIKIAACYDTLNIATTIEYEQVSIDEFEKKVNTIDSVVKTETVSAQEVINLTVNLEKALTRFLNSKMIAIPYENLIAGWNFAEYENVTELTGTGTRGLIATMKPGPSEIFGTNTSLPKFVKEGGIQSLYLNNGAHLEVEQYNPSDFLGKKLSICVWLKPEVNKGGNYVASLNYWENWKFQIQEQGKPFFTLKTSSGISDSDNESDLSVGAGKWTHVIISLDLEANTLSFIVNGGEKVKVWTNKEKPSLTGNQASAYQSPLGKMLPLMIGTSTTYEHAKVAFDWTGWDTPSSWDYFQGNMGGIKFYNTALTEGQAKWLYNLENSAFAGK